MSPSRSIPRPHDRRRAIAGVIGSGGSCPPNRARLAAGPQKLPDQLAGFIQSVASSDVPLTALDSAIIQQQNQSIEFSWCVLG